MPERDLTGLFAPKSIAVIGVSRSPEKVGSLILKNIIDSKFPGPVYPVNPQTGNIAGRQCYPDVASLPETVDLVVIAIPARAAVDVLDAVSAKGIKNVVIISAGFKESGPEGAALEKTLAEKASRLGLSVLGPNCLGFVNNTVPVNATFGQPVQAAGNLRFISQSGAIAAGLFDWCNTTSLGFSHFVTLGNKTVLSENDVLSYFRTESRPSADPLPGSAPVSPIGMYLESISGGGEFLRLTGQISRTDPVFIIKPGKSQAAARAMQSHTGAIAGEDDILDAALSQSGVIRCQTLEDFFDLSRAFSWEQAPAGPRVAVVSNAGGPAVITADAVSASGLQLARFDDDTRARLSSVLPRSASILNPVDVLGDALADRYAQAADIILSTDQADALLVILTPQIMTQTAKTAELISGLSAKYSKPIFCSFIGGHLVNEGEQILNSARIPSFRFPERAIYAISAMWKWHDRRLQPVVSPPRLAELPGASLSAVRDIVSAAVRENRQSLDSIEANDIVSLVGIPTPPTSAVAALEDARNFTAGNGWPVVLKLTSPGLFHKAKAGGVVTDIWDQNQLDLAWDRLNHKLLELPLEDRKDARFQIQKDVTRGVEVIIGLKHDPTFGPVLLFGAGGQLAELVADRNLKIFPVNRDQIAGLVAQSKVFRLLQTPPGEPPYALDQLYDLIINLTRLIPLIPEATDIEINPVIITHNAVWAVDSKIMIHGPVAGPARAPVFHTAAVSKAEVLAAKFHYFELDTEDPLVYQPGQYVSVKVAPDRINSYSIAGSENDRRFFLLVDTTPGGPGSKFFENLKVGDKIAYMGPFGTFTFRPEDGAGHILFLGTGTGCSPLRAILEGALKHTPGETPIDFLFGLRHSTDVFWQDYFQKLSAEHPNLKFTLTLSKPDESWQGPVGHITDLISQIPDGEKCSAYLCGNPAMIEEATRLLEEKNCPKERIYFEKF